MTTTEVQALLDRGWPLSRIEEYVDWLEAVEREVHAAFRAFDDQNQKPH